MALDPAVYELAGPPLVGYFLSWALLGVLNVQVYLYHIRFQHDTLILKSLVYSMLVIEWLQTCLLTVDAFDAFVYHYGDTSKLTGMLYGWYSLPIFCAVISVAVQFFFAWRIYRLSGLRWLVGGILLLSVIQGVFGIVAVSGVQLKDVSSTADLVVSRTAKVVDTIWMAGSALVDVIIAIVMTVLMLRLRNGMLKTDMIINKIIRLGIETGTLTAAVAIVGLALVMGCPGKLYYEPAIYTLSKLYSNTFVTNLLSRTANRQTLGVEGTRDLEAPSETQECLTGRGKALASEATTYDVSTNNDPFR